MLTTPDHVQPSKLLEEPESRPGFWRGATLNDRAWSRRLLSPRSCGVVGVPVLRSLVVLASVRARHRAAGARRRRRGACSGWQRPRRGGARGAAGSSTWRASRAVRLTAATAMAAVAGARGWFGGGARRKRRGSGRRSGARRSAGSSGAVGRRAAQEPRDLPDRRGRRWIRIPDAGAMRSSVGSPARSPLFVRRPHLTGYQFAR